MVLVILRKEQGFTFCPTATGIFCLNHFGFNCCLAFQRASQERTRLNTEIISAALPWLTCADAPVGWFVVIFSKERGFTWRPTVMPTWSQAKTTDTGCHRCAVDVPSPLVQDWYPWSMRPPEHQDQPLLRMVFGVFQQTARFWRPAVGFVQGQDGGQAVNAALLTFLSLWFGLNHFGCLYILT